MELINNVNALFKADPALKTALKRMISVYFLLAALVFTTGYLYFLSERRSIINEKKDDLSLLADLKVNQLINWRRERLEDAVQLSMLYFDPVMMNQISKASAKGEKDRLFYEYTKQVSSKPEYTSISLIDKSLNHVAFGSPSGRYVPLTPYERSQALDALNSGDIVFSDLYRNEINNSIGIDLNVPVQQFTKTGRKTSGVIVLKIDPEKLLYPFIQDFCPQSSKSCETLILRQEEDKVVFLNELKYRKNTALSFSISLSSPAAQIVSAALKSNNVVEGDDYRGVPVFACSRTIPGSNWSLVAKIDADEVYAPIRARVAVVGSLIATTLIAAAALLGFLLYAQVSRYRQKLYKAETEHKILSKKYSLIIKNANDIILLFDKDMKIIEANDMALRTYQYTQSEMLQKTIRDLMTSESLTACQADIDKVRDTGSNCYKTIHRKKDGTTFPVEIKSQQIIIEWNEYFLEIVRDISEYRGEQKAFVRSSELLESTLGFGSWNYDDKTQTIGVSKEMCRILGLNTNNYRISFEGFKSMVHPDDWNRFNNALKASLAGLPFNQILRIVFIDQPRNVLFKGVSQSTRSGHVTSIFGTAHTIVERKQPVVSAMA